MNVNHCFIMNEVVKILGTKNPTIQQITDLLKHDIEVRRYVDKSGDETLHHAAQELYRLFTIG